MSIDEGSAQAQTEQKADTEEAPAPNAESASSAESSSSSSPVQPAAPFKDPLPESGPGIFEGCSDEIRFSHTAKCCGPYDYAFTSQDGKELFKGKTIKQANCASLTFLECLGVCQPLERLTEVYMSGGDTKAFSLAIKPGFLDSSEHKVLDKDGNVVGLIQQPTFVQKMSEMWRNRMNIVIRVVDTQGYERWTLRRPGSCGDYQIELCKNLDFQFELSCDCSKYDCDYSKYNCGDCFGYCKLDGPCYACTSCNQCCNDPRCLCLINEGVPCCDINCYNCDQCCKQCEPKFCKTCCEPGCGCCDLKCKDCEVCCKPVCSLCAIVCSCQCKPKCCRCENWKCVRCDNCGANCKLLCSNQCAECKRCIGDCPDCGGKCKIFYSKCKPQCQLEWQKYVRCIPDFIACLKKCPHRCKIYACGGRPVHIELDVYGPDGDADVVQTKIMYDGYTGCNLGGATLRNGYTCTVHIPRASPYYKHYHKKERQLDFHDQSLLVGLAMWYDFYCVAPLAVNNCIEETWSQEDIDDHKAVAASDAPNIMDLFFGGKK